MTVEITLIITMFLGVCITLTGIFLLKKDKDNYNKEVDKALKNIENITKNCINEINSTDHKVNMNANDIFEKIDEKHSEMLVLYDLVSKKQSEIYNNEKYNKVSSKNKLGKDNINYEQRTNNQDDGVIFEKDDIDGVIFEPSENNTVETKSVDILIDDSTPVFEQKNTVNSKTDNNQHKDKTSKILDLYSQGLSITDIAKQLGIGKGEVQLVLDIRGNRYE